MKTILKKSKPAKKSRLRSNVTLQRRKSLFLLCTNRGGSKNQAELGCEVVAEGIF